MTNTKGMLWLMNVPGSGEGLTEGERYWLLHGVSGEPKATEAHTAEELRAMGYIGLYDPTRREEPAQAETARS